MITFWPSKMITFKVLSFMLSFGVIIYFKLTFNVIILDVIIWCYHLVLSFGVIIYLMLSFDVIISHSLKNVIIFVFSLYLVQHGCYHLCHHLMLSLFVIISPLFSFSWKRDTLPEKSSLHLIFLVSSVPDPWHFGVDPDPNPRIHASD
jgi:hypothetical protein